MDGLKLCARSF